MYLTPCPPFQIHGHLRSRWCNPPLGCRETRGFKCPLRLGLRCPKPFWPQSFTTLFPIPSSLFWVHGLSNNLCLHWTTYLKLIFHEENIFRKLPKLCLSRAEWWQAQLWTQWPEGSHGRAEPPWSTPGDCHHSEPKTQLGWLSKGIFF